MIVGNEAERKKQREDDDQDAKLPGHNYPCAESNGRRLGPLAV